MKTSISTRTTIKTIHCAPGNISGHLGLLFYGRHINFNFTLLCFCNFVFFNVWSTTTPLTPPHKTVFFYIIDVNFWQLNHFERKCYSKMSGRHAFEYYLLHYINYRHIVASGCAASYRPTIAGLDIFAGQHCNNGLLHPKFYIRVVSSLKLVSKLFLSQTILFLWFFCGCSLNRSDKISVFL